MLKPKYFSNSHYEHCTFKNNIFEDFMNELVCNLNCKEFALWK